MGFHGRFGNLSTLEAAKASLLDIEEAGVFPDAELKAHNENYSIPDRYDAARLLRVVEGLQMVILRNGGDLSFSKLPLLYKPRDKELLATYHYKLRYAGSKD